MKHLTETEISEIVADALDDKTSFEEIKRQYGISEKEVIKIMRTSLKRKSYLLWRKRVRGRSTKHRKLFKSRLLN